MAIETTPYGVKSQIVGLLDGNLNEGLPAASPERVDVFYGWMEADSRRQFVVVGDCDTDYGDGERMAARATLRRYNLSYNINLHLIPGLRYRTQQAWEEASYLLLDRVLTPLVRGDQSGRTRLADEVAGIQQVIPLSDTFIVPPDDNRDPLYPVLTLRIQVQLLRD